MKRYIKPELKYLSMIHEAVLAGDSEQVLPDDGEFVEGANKYGMLLDDEDAPVSKSVWE